MCRGSIPSKKLKRPASADKRQVAKKRMIKNPGKENFFLNGQKIVLGWPMRNTSNWCSATGAEIMKSTECLSKKQISSNLMLSNNTNAVKQHESSKPHQYYQSRYNHTSQTQLNLFISVVDLNLGQNCLDMGGTCKFQGGLVKIPLEQVPLAGKLKSLLWRL